MRSSGAVVFAVVALLAVDSCARTTVRRADDIGREYPAGMLQIRWRIPVHEHGLFEARPEECAVGTLVGSHYVTGSRAGRVLSIERTSGQVRWSVPTSGSVDGAARFAQAHGQIYVGTDDGTFYAMEPADGRVRWSFRARGSIDRLPEVGADAVYFTTAQNRVFALDARTGKLRWQYERDAPEGFTIHGHAGPRLQDGVLYVGFADGYLVALRAEGGEVLWARSLAGASEQYVDVDSTPLLLGDLLLASSFSGGLYGLGVRDGEVRWRLSVEGAGSVRAAGQRLYFAAPRDGLAALTPDGHVLWRQGLADAGDVTAPVAVGPYLLFSGTRAGLFVVDRETGKLLQVFNPGRGMCSEPTLDAEGRNVYILANSGSLYALQLAR